MALVYAAGCDMSLSEQWGPTIKTAAAKPYVNAVSMRAEAGFVLDFGWPLPPKVSGKPGAPADALLRAINDGHKTIQKTLQALQRTLQGDTEKPPRFWLGTPTLDKSGPVFLQANTVIGYHPAQAQTKEEAAAEIRHVCKQMGWSTSVTVLK